MSIFTVVLEFDGGTFVAQINALDEKDAVRKWCGQLRENRAVGAQSARLASAIERSLKDSALVTVSGLSGVWCFTTLFARKLVLGHLVATIV